jgi:adenylate cyclase
MVIGRATICKGCWQQLRVPVPLRGVLSGPFRAFGIRPSRMNPDTCTICELMFTRVMRASKVTIDATVLFADLRSYTNLSQNLSADAVSHLLGAFYDECASAIWAHEGLLNKTIGDAVMAVFNFPIKHPDHPARAVLAAREIHLRCRSRSEALTGSFGLAGGELSVGVGIHTGEVSFGEFGQAHRDLTAIGNVVNIASRVQSAAAGGQILVTHAVYERAATHLGAAEIRTCQLKGFDEPMELYVA